MHREVVKDEKRTPRQPLHDHFLFEGLDYPATKQELVDFATDGSTDADLLSLVRALPDRDYLSRDDVWRAWAEAVRRLGGGGRDLGTPRDDMGKEAKGPLDQSF